MDDCGNGTSFKIRNTGGTWHFDCQYSINFGECNNCGGNCRPTNYGATNYVYEDTDRRWTFMNTYNCVHGPCPMTWANGANPLPPSPYNIVANAVSAFVIGPCVGTGCRDACAPSVAKLALEYARRQTWMCP
jgi:hypothetical protein